MEKNILIKKTNILKTQSKKITKKALLIGCNYLNTEYQLSGCINDVSNLETLLKTLNFSVQTMTDLTEKKPIKTNILTEFTNILKNSSAGDTIFFSFSGHGSQINDKNKDEKDNLDELIFTLDAQYIVDDDLNKIIKTNLKKKVKLIALFDCCHSGTVLDLKYQYLGNGNRNTVNSNYTDTVSNVIMISGSLDTQTSADAFINKTYQGAMTWAFIESFDVKLTIFELVTKMRKLLKQNKYAQIPQLSSGLPLLATSTLF